LWTDTNPRSQCGLKIVTRAQGVKDKKQFSLQNADSVPCHGHPAEKSRSRNRGHSLADGKKMHKDKLKPGYDPVILKDDIHQQVIVDGVVGQNEVGYLVVLFPGLGQDSGGFIDVGSE
jgi:hypothetical protein